MKHIDRTSSPAHVGQLRSPIDLVADEDTPVLAAADGIVTFFKDSSNSGGLFYWDHSNFIVIMHSNGEYSRYDHLKYKSSKVTVDQYVRVGRDCSGGNDWLYVSTTSSLPGFCSYWYQCMDRL